MISDLILLFIISACIYLGYTVYCKDRRAKENKLFAVLIFWLVIFILSNYFENETISPSLRIVSLHIDFVSASILGYFWFLFCFYFLEDKKKIIWLYHLLSLGMLFLINFLLFKGEIVNDYDTSGQLIRFSFGRFYSLYAVFIIYSYIGGLSCLLLKYKRFKGMKKIQTLYILSGFFISCLTIIIINLFYQNQVPLAVFRFGTYNILFLIALTTYAIVKHHLFDIRSLVQKSIIYSCLSAVVAFFYLACVLMLNVSLQRSTDIITVIPAVITTIVGIFSVPYLEKIFRKATDKIFYQDKYDDGQALYELGEVLSRNIEFEITTYEVLKKLSSILKIETALLFYLEKSLQYEDGTSPKPAQVPAGIIKLIETADKPIFITSQLRNRLEAENNPARRSLIEEAAKWCREKEVEAVLAIYFEKRVCCLFALGNKRSGDYFDKDDIKLLMTFSRQAELALAKTKLYEAIKEYSGKLELKVRQRTEKIQNLQESQRQMMCEIAHGLQTPLTILKGELELSLQGGPGDSKNREMMRTIDRISVFIYNMLKLAKLENNETPLRKEPINLSELLADLIDEYRVIAADKKIRLNYKNKTSADMWIMGDNYEISDLISNLASNSFKYMNSGQDKQIRFELRSAGGKAEIEIADNGIGMDNNTMSMIFNPYYRAANTASEGTGLGLAICKSIIKRHNGEIKVESEPGKGTKFLVLLPLSAKPVIC